MVFEQLLHTHRDLIIRVLGPIYNFAYTHTNRWFFAYLLFSFIFAVILVSLRQYDGKVSLSTNLRRIVKRVFDSRVFGHESAKLDYKYAVINHLVTTFVLIYFFVAANVLSSFFYRYFGDIPYLDKINISVGIPGSLFIVAIYTFAYDTSNFFQHRLQHKIPVLWEFHKVHHSAEVLTPVTAVRTHPVSQMIAATVSAIVFGTMNGLFYNLFEGPVANYSLLGANIFTLLYFTIGLYHIRHSHIWFTYPKFVKEVLASPSLHFIHHSNNPRHYDKNFAFVFTFWDRIFGSYYEPDESEQYDLTLGISDSEGRTEYMSVSQLYFTPFKRAWARHVKPGLQRVFGNTV